MLRRTHRRRIAVARARQRGGEGSRAAQGEVAQLVGALELDGELGRHQCVFSGGGSLRSMMDTASPATIHPGEHGIVTAMTWGGYGWKELIGGGLGCANRAGVSAARVVAISARDGSSGLVAGVEGD